MAQKPRALVWLRRDLRLEDHSSLARAESEGFEAALAFVFDRNLLAPLPQTDRRLSFLHASLAEIDEELHSRGSALVTRVGDPAREIPALARALRAEVVLAAEDFEPYARKRDAAVAKALKNLGIRFELLGDEVIFPGGAIVNGAGTPYKVFTPYKKAWLARLAPAAYEKRGVKLPTLTPHPKLPLERYDLKTLGFTPQKLWLEPGAKAGARRLRQFGRRLAEYKKTRDLPAQEGTSGLSAHLRFGTVSIRACVRLALEHQGMGSDTWLGELVWRDFFQMVLDQFPQVGRGEAFRAESNKIRWPGKEAHFRAWCDGETGYPIVDATMRLFRETGWMHNRMRMVVASFLTKDLLIDWRRGEAFFAAHLLDFDFAANNGGWQWCASTGCDAQPYFRIFNPESQSRKFDAEGAFLRAHLPELRHLGNREIHAPPAVPGYPARIVNHGEQRAKALALFRKIP